MDEFRKQKADQLRAAGTNPYAAKFDRSHTCQEGHQSDDGVEMQVAGRVMLMRSMGKLTFITLQDHTGTLQIALKAEDLGDEYQRALDFIDRGDFIGVNGVRFTTKKGEPTVQVIHWTMLSKALRQPPEKWAGVVDQETTWRQRYLDTMSNRKTFDRFMFRSAFIKRLREFYWEHGFVEVDTPVLVNAASGTLATPFTTHHEAYDIDVYLRIATETYLKECIIGGFDRVFEIGRIFRNEGVDPSHLQDFTMVEHYATYWDFEDNMNFTEKMLSTIIQDLLGTTKVDIPDRDGNMVEVDFAAGWKRVSLTQLIEEACGINIDEHITADALRNAIKEANIKLEVDIANLGRGNLIDQLYKKVARPKLINPVFVTQQPVDVSPLARRNDDNPNITDRFQLVVGTWEVNNAYSELIDPIDQAQRFEDQAKANAEGDSDAHEKDDEYVKALEYGCPPNSGLGMGIDRIVALITQQSNLRDVVLFPLMKPEDHEASTPKVKTPAQKIITQEDQPSELPDETQKRFIAVLNKKVEPGKLMNALGHMTAGLSRLVDEQDDPCFLQYSDADGGLHPNISHYPFIVLKADNSNKIRKVRNEADSRNIPFVDFTSTMTHGTSQQQQDATKSTKEEDLEYYGIGLFGTTAELKEFTGKFSLFN